MNVAIVGLGITGASLAILLSRLGIKVSVFEQSHKMGPIGAGILLQPSGQLVLKAMGLFEETVSNAETIKEVFVRTHRGQQLVRLVYNEWEETLCAYGLHRGRLFNTLHSELIKSGVEIKLGTRIVSFCGPDNSSLVDSQGEQHGNFDWIFACDGSSSVLIDQAGLSYREKKYLCGAFWFVGDSSCVREKLLQVTKGTQRLAGLLPTGKSECSFFWGATKEESELIRNNFESWKSQVIQLFPETAEILHTLENPENLIFTNWKHRKLETISNGRVLFMGDAAFASTPHLGQGVNLGLLDAWTYYQSFKSFEDFKTATNIYIQERIRQRNFYASLSYLISPFFQSINPGLGTLRDLTLPLLCSLSPYRKQMISVLSGLRKGWLGGTVNI